MKLEIWDIAGGETYREVSNMYYRDADGAILVFDLTNRQSFESLKSNWLKELREKAPPNINIAIIGNKTDMKDQEVVSLKEL